MRPIDLARGVRNALILIGKCDWREFLIRLRISLGQIDLKDDPTEAVSERTYYYADSGGLAFDKIMAHFKISPDDAIVDFGCGKGGILINLSKYPFAKIAGVEIDPELAEIARENIRKLRIRNVEIVCCDAADFNRLNEFNYLYFFDPFPAVVMRDVIRNIEKSIAEKPRKVTIIYLNPSCHDLFDARDVLRKTAELPHFEHRCYVYSNAE